MCTLTASSLSLPLSRPLPPIFTCSSRIIATGQAFEDTNRVISGPAAWSDYHGVSAPSATGASSLVYVLWFNKPAVGSAPEADFNTILNHVNDGCFCSSLQSAPGAAGSSESSSSSISSTVVIVIAVVVVVAVLGVVGCVVLRLQSGKIEKLTPADRLTGSTFLSELRLGGLETSPTRTLE
jgi:hypothetical protein